MEAPILSEPYRRPDRLSHLCAAWGAANFALAVPWMGMLQSF
jgi:hypothetical protein